MKHEINWTAGNGSEIKAVVELVTKETINADGQKIDVDVCKIETTFYVDGKIMATDMAGFVHPKLKALGVVAMAGKVGIKAENYDKIQDAISACKSTKAWAEHQAKIEKNNSECDEYEAHRSKMQKVMGY